MKGMRTKKKLLGTLAGWVISLMFIASWAVLGVVLALQEASVNLGGSIEFIAKDIYADITGRVTGTKEPVTLDDIHFSAETQTFDTPTSWSNMNLNIDEDINNVEIIININNKSAHPLWVAFTDKTLAENTTITRKVGDKTLAKFKTIKIEGRTSQEVEVIIKIADKNYDVAGNINLALKLSSEEIPLDVSDCAPLLFSLNEENKTASVYTQSSGILNESTSMAISGDIEIPSKVLSNGEVYKVTKIQDEGFAYCDGLTSITIPEGVTHIGEGAFLYCGGLTSVNIPASVTYIENGEDKAQPFAGCYGLETITVADKNQTFTAVDNALYQGKKLISGTKNSIVKDDTTEIGAYAFSMMQAPENLNLPSTLNKIGAFAFVGSDISNISLPDALTSVGEGAFDGCENLTYNTYDNAKYLGNETNPYLLLMDTTSTNISSCEINSGCKFIYDSAFYDCSSLQSINIPASVTSIGYSAFADCSSLTSIMVDTNNSVYTSYENGIYKGTTLIQGCQTTIIKEDTTKIEDNAFYGQSNLKTVTIPAGLTTLGESAFFGCSNLETLTIIDGRNLTNISDSTFGNCFKINLVFSDNNPLTSIDFLVSKLKIRLVGVYNIPAGVTKISDSMFYVEYPYSSKLTTVTFAEGSKLESIGGAFYYCRSLQSINIPASVKSIGNFAFGWCSNLTSVTFAEGSKLESIGERAFDNCSSLQSINIPASVKSIGNSAFYNCSSLQSINIPASVTSIGSFAFSNCSSLQSINIPASVKSIGNYAFYYCSSLTSITVDKNNSVYSSYENGLYKGTTLIAGCQTTIIKEGTTEIYEYAFYEQTNLKSITIPASVKSIGKSAFGWCSSLTSVTFANPNGWSVTRNSTTTQLSSTDLSNTSTAAKYLRDTYRYYTWTRS